MISITVYGLRIKFNVPIKSRRETINARIDANKPVITVAISGVPVGGKMCDKKLNKSPSELIA